jgi:UDP-galactopyranose mutase
MFENMLNDIHVELNVNYFDNREYFESVAKKVVFTGKIDEFFDYEYGELEYRCLDFKHEVLENEDNYQGAVVINYPEKKYSHTRIIEHKHFTGNKSKNTVITYENPIEYSRNKTPYYPINDERNQKIFEKYRSESKTIKNVIFGGRLSEYRYYDMHQVIGSSMKIFNDEKK